VYRGSLDMPFENLAGDPDGGKLNSATFAAATTSTPFNFKAVQPVTRAQEQCLAVSAEHRILGAIGVLGRSKVFLNVLARGLATLLW